MNPKFVAIFAIPAFISCVLADSSISSVVTVAPTSNTSNASSTITPSTPTVVVDVDTPYFIETLPYQADAPGGTWGVNATLLANFVHAPRIFPLAVGSPGVEFANYTQCNVNTTLIQGAFTNSSKIPVSLRTSEVFAQNFNFGPPLEKSTNSSICTQIEQVPTVPFGVNIGVPGSYNGSIALNGWYDSNRIASTSWHLIAESTNQITILEVGTLSISVSINSQLSNVLLDFNNQFIEVPFNHYHLCGNDSFVVSFAGANGQPGIDIPMPPSTTNRTSTCVPAANEDDIYVLGLPFFQAAYTYVDKTGQIFITAANNLSSSIGMKKFDPNATLTLPPGVTAFTATPTKKSMALPRFALDWYILPYGVRWDLALLGLLVILIVN